MRAPVLPLCGALLLALVLSGCPQTVSGTCGNPGEPCCGGAACSTGAECAPEEQVCRACGSEGLGCCSGACSPGFRCEANVCRAQALCGAVGEPCCAGNACSGALRCENQSCIQPCGDGCVPGTQRCSTSGGVDVCNYTTAPCTAWSALLLKCPTGQSCQSGVCVEQCPGACTLQSTLCTNEGLKVCELDTNTGCPVYKVAPPSPDSIVCMTGACDGPICWESPLPQGNPLMGVTGWASDQLFFPDNVGNVVRLNGTSWEYDWRNNNGGAFNAVTNCGLGTRSFAVGSQGRAWLRNSVGWQLEHVGDATATLTAVACDGAPRAVAVGLGGKAFWRNDTGQWKPLPTATTQPLHGVAYDPFTTWAWLVGGGGTVVRCGPLHEGTPVTCAPEATGFTTRPLNAGWTNLGASEVVVVGGQGTVLRRDSNGTWSQVAQAVTSADLLAVHGLESNGDIYAAGEGGAFIHRVGTDWFAESFTPETLTGIYAVDESNLWVSSLEGSIWFNDARGAMGPATSKRWRQRGGHAPATRSLESVHGLGLDDLYAVGNGGLVLHKSGDTWRVEAASLTTADLHGVFALSPDEIYAVGNGGTILARRNGVWAIEGAGTTSNPLFGVWSDGTTVFAVGAAGTWLEKPAGAAGNLWVRVNQTATTAFLARVSGRTGEVYAVGSSCTLLMKKSGQFQASAPPGCNGDGLFALWVGSDGELFVGGENALFLHRPANGDWIREYPGNTLETYLSVAKSGNDVFVTATSGELYHYSANVWRQEVEGLTAAQLYDAFPTPEGHQFFVGAGGLIWHRR